jgi:hypothetical protein
VGRADAVEEGDFSFAIFAIFAIAFPFVIKKRLQLNAEGDRSSPVVIARRCTSTKEKPPPG